MPAANAPTGYSRLKIALHWLVVAPIVQQDNFEEAMSAAWDRVTDALETGFGPLAPARAAGGAMATILALWRLMPRDAIQTQMRRAQD